MIRENSDELPLGNRGDASDPAAAVSNDIDQTSHTGRKDQMNIIIEQGLKRMDDRKIKYQIAGTEYVLQDQLEQAAKFVLSAKDFVGEAVKACPEASLAWAGVCLVLPILSNPSTTDKANLEGIAYVTSKMRYYCALEELLLPRNLNPSGHDLSWKKFREEFESHVLKLYGLLLKFQMKSVCRYYRSRIGNLSRDIVNFDDWNQMVLSIKEQETAIEKESQQINTERSLSELKGLLRNSESVLGCFTDLLSLMQEQLSVTKEHRDISAQQLELSRRKEQRKISQEEQTCLQIFSGTDYKWYKDRIESRVVGTCQWLLTQENYNDWLQQPSGPLLVSADPGCGKSVLAKFLIDEELPRSATICYFFFKDQDQNNAKQALCALLHQLLSQKYHLIKHAMPAFVNNGENLPKQFSVLWSILIIAAADPEAGELICVLDALDECEESEMRTLIGALTQYFNSRQSRISKLKFLLTSRPYDNIVTAFQGLVDIHPYIRIPGEEDSETISKEVNYVIKHMVKILANEKALDPDLTEYLEQLLLEITHRTYLWVFLVFDFLRTHRFKRTKNGVQDAIKTLPKSAEEAYEKILNKSLDKDKTRRLLSIVIAAYRPLTLKEMNIALEVTPSSKSVEDLDLENESDFKGTIREYCGLFVSIHQDRIYLIHQTAKEFLLQDTEISPSLPETRGWWKHSISLKEGNCILAEICVIYLSFDAFDTGFCLTDEDFETRLRLYPLYDYAAQNWGHHARVASSKLEPIILDFLESEAKVSSSSQALMVSGSYNNYSQGVPMQMTGAHFTAYFGLEEAMIVLLKNGHDPNFKDTYGRTPLSWAAENGHEAVVKQLLATERVDPDSKDDNGRTPLSWAAENGHEAVVKQLLATERVDPDSKDDNGQTPLSWAAENGHEAVVKQLQSA
jgi:hypothetical protein